jgi:hypothetical protein
MKTTTTHRSYYRRVLQALGIVLIVLLVLAQLASKEWAQWKRWEPVRTELQRERELFLERVNALETQQARQTGRVLYTPEP